MRFQMKWGGWAALLAIGLAGLAWMAGGSRALADESVVDDLEIGNWVPHAECSFFGSHREDYMLSGLGAELLAAQRRSELTAAVTSKLSVSAGAPLRSRTSARGSEPGPSAGASIDAFIFGELERQGIPPAPPTTDSEFLRRVTLDLTGRIPTAAEAGGVPLRRRGRQARAKIVRACCRRRSGPTVGRCFSAISTAIRAVTAQVNRFPGGRDAFHLFLLESFGQTSPTTRWCARCWPRGGYSDGRPWPAAESCALRGISADINDFQGTPAEAHGSELHRRRPDDRRADARHLRLLAYDRRARLSRHQRTWTACCATTARAIWTRSTFGASSRQALRGWGLSAFFEKVHVERPRYGLPAARGGASRGPAVLRRLDWAHPSLRNATGSGRRRLFASTPTSGNRPARQAGRSSAARPWSTRCIPSAAASRRAGEPLREALGRY